MPTPSLDEIRLLLREYSGLRYRRLSFPKALEVRFEHDTATRRCARLWLEGLIVIGLFNLFLLPDYFAASQAFSQAFFVRLGVVTPLALLVNVAMLFRPHRLVRESSIVLVAGLAGLTQLGLESGRTPVASAYAQFGVLAVILFCNCVMRLRFPFAVGVTCLMLGGDVLFLHTDRNLLLGQKLLGLCLTLGCAASTLVSNYSSNREERVNYLLCLQGDLMVDQLARANQELTVIAEHDRLTGLLNRHAFDRCLAEQWERARSSRSDLSIILVDIDHFKQINDTWGHLYGDRVLRRIGHLLSEAMRRKDDVAARFGGEEFVLLLPETSGEMAQHVAERIRTLIETAGLPATNNFVTPIDGALATVSCGVASCVPSSREEPLLLLAAADRALYRAKSAGRNQVQVA